MFHSLCEFICVLILLCLKTLFSRRLPALLALMIFPLAFLHSFLGYEGRSLMKATHMAKCFKVISVLVPFYSKRKQLSTLIYR